MTALAALLILASGVGRATVPQCDLIEINHFYSESGDLKFAQVIAFDWSHDYHRLDAQAWVIAGRKLCRLWIHATFMGGHRYEISLIEFSDCGNACNGMNSVLRKPADGHHGGVQILVGLLGFGFLGGRWRR